MTQGANGFIDGNKMRSIALGLCRDSQDKEWIEYLYSQWVEFDRRHFEMIFTEHKDVPLILIDYDMPTLGRTNVPGGRFSFPPEYMDFKGSICALSEKYNVSVIRVRGTVLDSERSAVFPLILLHEMLHLWVDYQWRDKSRVEDQEESVNYWCENSAKDGSLVDLHQDCVRQSKRGPLEVIMAE